MPDQISERDDLRPGVLGQRVRAAIQARGVTQQSVADAVGMGVSALSRALAGQRNFSSTEFARICDALLVSPLSLLGDGQPVTRDALADAAVSRFRHLTELDALLAEVGLPARSDRWPFTLLDRAIEAYVRGEISIRPVAGLLGADPDDLLDQLPSARPKESPGA